MVPIALLVSHENALEPTGPPIVIQAERSTQQVAEEGSSIEEVGPAMFGMVLAERDVGEHVALGTLIQCEFVSVRIAFHEELAGGAPADRLHQRAGNLVPALGMLCDRFLERLRSDRVPLHART